MRMSDIEISCNCHSLIPSPKTAAICEGTFKKFDRDIKALTALRPQDFTFFDANRVLRNKEDGSIKMKNKGQNIYQRGQGFYESNKWGFGNTNKRFIEVYQKQFQKTRVLALNTLGPKMFGVGDFWIFQPILETKETLTLG